MKIVVLGGYGEMGRVVCSDLSQTFKGDIVVAGRDGKKADDFAKKFKNKRITAKAADISDKASMNKVLEGARVVINATNYYTNVEVMEHALASGVDYLDLGGLYHVTLKQLKLHSQFKKKHRLALLGCGATPGITNIMANHASRLLDKIDSIHIQFGDKDYTDYKMPFVVPYSMRTIIDEFTKKPAVFEDGKMKFVEPLSGSIDIPFPKPLGNLPCFYTLHSELASMPDRFKDKGIRNCSFRGGFDSKFVSQVKFLIDGGFASEEEMEFNGIKIRPIDFTVKLLDRFLPPSDIKVNDIEFLRVELSGKKKNSNKKLVMYCKSISDKKFNIPAGSWDTGVPPSIIAQMIAEDKIKAEGVLPSDSNCIDSHYFFRMLEQRSIEVSMKNS